MRILVVSQYFWPENFRVNDLVQAWCEAGHSVTVLTGLPNYPQGEVFADYIASPERYKDFHGAKVIRTPLIARGTGGLRLMANYASFAISACIAGAWHLRKQSFDVIFVFEPSPVTVGLPAILLRRLKRAPVVFWALDLWPETLAAVGVVRSSHMLAVVGMLVKFIYRRCDVLLGQSKGFLPSLRRYAGNAADIRFFPSWAEDVFGCESEPAPELAKDPAFFTILFAGNVGEAQDFPAVLAAAELLRERPVRWVIVGDGRMTDWLKQEVERRGLEQQVLLLGRYPVERMPSFYAHADALLVSLKSDPVFALTIPGKVQSYLLSGVPVLAMLDGEGARVIDEAEAGIAVPAGKAADLADAISRMAAMPEEHRAQMGRCGRTYALREFDRATLLKQLEQCFVELCAHRKLK
ncbi:glycosyltransferase family 4 protein [Chitinolyticbacter meiyuanensis]|uniref:glycosyltransferase family 4 protein n=1 Tax=Chitinolyticbacter meiyuanensis TaxID=682798 RepID=UPI0011E5E851|nr:glycosyltransferase family 4 protein [Chitinolyticbacter meiyuanensis]